MNSRLRGYGVDIDAKLVERVQSTGQERGPGEPRPLRTPQRLRHRPSRRDRRDHVAVPELMRLLRPVILERARPGTRVLTSTWDLGTLAARRGQHETARRSTCGSCRRASAAAGNGSCRWRDGASATRRCIEQQFQEMEGVARAGDRREVLEAMSLTRRRHRLHAEHHARRTRPDPARVQRQGRRAIRLPGTVKVTPLNQAAVTLAWRAKRSVRQPTSRRRDRDVCQARRQALSTSPRGVASRPGHPERRSRVSQCWPAPGKYLSSRLALVGRFRPGRPACLVRNVTCSCSARGGCYAPLHSRPTAVPFLITPGGRRVRRERREQFPDRAIAAASGSGATIAGTVSGAGASGMTVAVAGTTLSTGVESSGSFRLGGVPAGNVQLQFRQAS